MEYISDHFYVVFRYGDRCTHRSFLSYPDALKYYDQRCKASKGYKVELQEYVKNRKPYSWTVVYINDRTGVTESATYRDMYKKKKTDGQMHPFGL